MVVPLSYAIFSLYRFPFSLERKKVRKKPGIETGELELNFSKGFQYDSHICVCVSPCLKGRGRRAKGQRGKEGKRERGKEGKRERGKKEKDDEKENGLSVYEG